MKLNEIITSFQVMGRKYTVKQTDKLNDDTMGLTNYITQEVSIRKNFAGHKMHQDQINITIIHEITHAILNAINKHELNNDEELVDNIAGCLLEIVKSIKFKKK